MKREAEHERLRANLSFVAKYRKMLWLYKMLQVCNITSSKVIYKFITLEHLPDTDFKELHEDELTFPSHPILMKMSPSPPNPHTWCPHPNPSPYVSSPSPPHPRTLCPRPHSDPHHYFDEMFASNNTHILLLLVTNLLQINKVYKFHSWHVKHTSHVMVLFSNMHYSHVHGVS